MITGLLYDNWFTLHDMITGLLYDMITGLLYDIAKINWFTLWYYWFL